MTEKKIDAMGEIQQNLDELIKEYDNEDKAFEGEMDYGGSPKNKYLRIENKNFYFDIKTKKQGWQVDDISFNFDSIKTVKDAKWS